MHCWCWWQCEWNINHAERKKTYFVRIVTDSANSELVIQWYAITFLRILYKYYSTKRQLLITHSFLITPSSCFKFPRVCSDNKAFIPSDIWYAECWQGWWDTFNQALFLAGIWLLRVGAIHRIWRWLCCKFTDYQVSVFVGSHDFLFYSYGGYRSGSCVLCRAWNVVQS